MKLLTLCLVFIPVHLFSQFGFERNDDINVIENNIVQKYAWAGGLDLAQYSNIDLNFDGVPDLFIFDRSCNKVLTFLQNGASGQMDLEYAPQYESRFPKMKNWALLVDYNGDGKNDIYTSNHYGITVYKNTSSATSGLNFTMVSLSLPAIFEIGGNTQDLHINSLPSDIPALSDIDDDGDIDVLSFWFNAPCIRYYKNLSQELYGHSNALEYQCVNVCYGNFTEDDASNVNLNTCCLNQVDNPESDGPLRPNHHIIDRDAGSTLLSIDLDGDDMEDLVMGDVSSNNLISLMNDGTAPNTNIDMVSPDFAFPSYDSVADVTLFPASFYVDVDNDDVRDLIVAPNSVFTSNNFHANWLYLNDGADNHPDFNLETKQFLQGEMIDHGSHSYPVFFDHNGDGLEDLIVAIGGRYDSTSENRYSRLYYYENTGTASAPEFTLMDEDYLFLSNFDNHPHYFYRPAFGDADGDGDEDLVLADIYDTIYYFQNISGVGQVAQFNVAVPLLDANSQIINEGQEVAPEFVDLDRDGKLDLVFGKRNGKLSYYKNIGINNDYRFAFVTDNLGNVDVSGQGSNIGIAVPEFIDIAGEYHLICGAEDGYLHYYNNIEGNWFNGFDLVTHALHQINTGKNSTPLISDLNGDNRLEMLVGNFRGGLSYFQSAIIDFIDLVDYNLEDHILIYPNPATSDFYIDLHQLNIGSYQSAKYRLSDISGRLIKEGALIKTKTNIDCKAFTKGVYFLSVNLDGQTVSQKIVID